MKERHDYLLKPQRVSLTAEGWKDSAIARKLDLSTATVRTYVQRIRTRLNLTSRQAIAAWVPERVIPGRPEEGLRRADPERVGP